MERLNLNRTKKSQKNFVKHEGSILNISNGILTVALKGNINCEACNAKGACGVSETNAKEIEVYITDESFQINENVEVSLEKQLGLKAVFWAYVFPFILVLFVLIISSNFVKEWVSGLLSLFILFPYYLTLYAMQNAFKKAFKVTISKNSLS
jgi:positive regulator of sigma E activity